MDDLLKGTGADVINFARPKRQNIGDFSASDGVSPGFGGGGNGDVLFLEDAPAFMSSPASAATAACSAIATSGASSIGLDGAPRIPVGEAKPSAVGGVLPLQLEEDAQPQALGAQIGSKKESVDCGWCSPPLAEDQAAGGATVVDTSADASAAEAKLRVVAAAMRTVAVALSALSGARATGSTDGEQQGEKKLEDVGGTAVTGAKDPPPLVSGEATASSVGWRSGGELVGARADDERGTARGSLASSASDVAILQGGSRMAVFERGESGNDPGARGAVQHTTDVAPQEGNEGETEAEDAAAVGSAAAEAAVPVGAENDGVVAAMVGTGVAEGATPGGSFGGELARAAGTPTVDAISGDVHLVAVVAGKRSLTRLLHFVDLVSDGGFRGLSWFENSSACTAWFVRCRMDSMPLKGSICAGSPPQGTWLVGTSSLPGACRRADLLCVCSFCVFLCLKALDFRRNSRHDHWIFCSEAWLLKRRPVSLNF